MKNVSSFFPFYDTKLLLKINMVTNSISQHKEKNGLYQLP